MTRTIASCNSACRRGFTLIELLVVMAIIGMLVGLLLPAINSARESGRRSTCANNLKQLITAMLNYETSNQCFPPGRVGCDAFTGVPCGSSMQGAQRQGTSGFLCILPQLDQMPLYTALTPLAKGAVYPAMSDSTTSGWNTTAIINALGGARPAVFACPTDHAQASSSALTPPSGTSSYAMVLGSLGAGSSPAADEGHQKYYNNGAFIYSLARRASDVRDGPTNTYFIGETVDGDNVASLNNWPLAVAYLSGLRATDTPLNTPTGSGQSESITNNGITSLPTTFNGAFISRHPQGANFAYGGGNVKFTSDQIDFTIYQALSTIAGSEAVPSDN